MSTPIPRALCAATVLLGITIPTVAASPDPSWLLGPFHRPPSAQPVIQPNPASTFACPMRKTTVRWEASHTFNPAAIVRDNRVWVLYRAEDDSGGNYVGGHTSRLGLGTSDDGLAFERRPTPVLFPADDDQRRREWTGGCEDPRCIELENGTYVVFYTQYSRADGGQPEDHTATTDLGVATSTDLVHWVKKGPALVHRRNGAVTTIRKSVSPVTALQGGRLIAKRIHGRYWMYAGVGEIEALSSEDLLDWNEEANPVLAPRPRRFDSGLVECGPLAVLTERGIVLIYNGMNASDYNRDPDIAASAYCGGQALFAASAPAHLVDRTPNPFFQPELPWEKTGQYAAGTTFLEGLVYFHGQWLLYYGCADSRVGVAMAPAGD